MTRAAAFSVVLAVLALISLPARAIDGQQLASDQGCLNCHQSQSRSSPSPSLHRLADRLGQSGDTPEVLAQSLGEMRGQATIHGHRMVPDEAALAILKWMAQGAR